MPRRHSDSDVAVAPGRRQNGADGGSNDRNGGRDSEERLSRSSSEGCSGSSSSLSGSGAGSNNPFGSEATATLLDLLLLARKYMIPRLYQQCIEKVQQQLCDANATALLVWAEDNRVEEVRPLLWRHVVHNLHRIITQHPATLNALSAKPHILMQLLLQEKTGAAATAGAAASYQASYSAAAGASRRASLPQSQQGGGGSGGGAGRSG